MAVPHFWRLMRLGVAVAVIGFGLCFGVYAVLLFWQFRQQAPWQEAVGIAAPLGLMVVWFIAGGIASLRCELRQMQAQRFSDSVRGPTNPDLEPESTTSGHAAEKCDCCGSRPMPEDRLSLWDQHIYCRQCVARHSALLARCADDDECLEYELTLKESLLLWQVVVVSILGCAAVLLVAFLLFPEWFPRIIFLSPIIIGFFILKSFVGTILTRPQTLRICDGKVEIKLPLQTLDFRLADCFWDLDGRLPGLMPQRFSKTPAIVLQTVSGLSRIDAYACVDGKDRELWAAFLTFAAKQGTAIVFGVPPRRP